MKISHDEYLKRTLRSKKVELESLNVNHRISIAEYEVKRQAITDQIDSIEKQLNA